MPELIDSCMQTLMAKSEYKIQVISWRNSFRKSFYPPEEIDLIINLTSHSFHNKNYKGDNLIQIPFLQNLKEGISRELYQSIINKEDGFHLSIIKTYTGKQRIESEILKLCFPV